MTQDDRRDPEGDDPDRHPGPMPSAARPDDVESAPEPVPILPPEPVVLKRLPREPITFWGSVLSLAIGAVGSVIFVYLHLPLPWFLGALTACLVASVLNAPMSRPAPLSIPMRCVLGVAVGSAFTPLLFGQIGGMMVSLAMLVPFMVLIIGIGIPFFERIAGFNRATAFYCAVPGGLTDMVSMAEDSGASGRTVTLVQATRILIIVFTLPFWLQWQSGVHISPTAASPVRVLEMSLIDAAILTSLGLFGWLGARAIGMAGAPIVGPMILSGLIHALGFTSARMPLEILVIAQITVGTLLGSQFRGLTWREFSSTVVWGVAFTILLLGLTAVVVIGVAHLTGFNTMSVMLAYAPGGQTEINLLTYILGLDVAYVALHHLARLAIVILGAQIVFATTRGFGKSQR